MNVIGIGKYHVDDLPEEDIDSTYSSDEVSKLVEEQMETEKELQPKAATSTTSFKVMIVTIIAGVLVTSLIGMGWIPEEMKENSVAVFSSVLLGIIGWITVKFVEGRSAVNVAKVEAASQLALLQASHEQQLEINQKIDEAETARALAIAEIAVTKRIKRTKK